jgi:hypothetical protein
MRYRYAVYFVPERDSSLHKLGSGLLGYDIYSGQTVSGHDLPLPEGLSIERLTEEPRRYGLHATVVAPFFPHDTNEANLLRDAAHFCRSASQVTVPRMQVVKHRGFMALRPIQGGRHEQHAYERLRSLAAEAVRFFFPLRTPPGPAELARRLAEKLSSRQAANVLEWGYPYIFDEYDFHITLTGTVQETSVQTLQTVLFHYFGEATAKPLKIDHLCLCRQPVSGMQTTNELPAGLFTVLERFPLTKVHIQGEAL